MIQRDSETRPLAGPELDEPFDHSPDLAGDLWTLLESGDELGVVLQRLSELAVRMFPPGYHASITVFARDDDAPTTVATTNTELLAVDQVQYDTQAGPCMDAARTGEPTRTDLDGARELWPAFAVAAENAGFKGYLSAPLLTDTGGGESAVIGSFNLYSGKNECFDQVDAALLTLFTTSALAAIANALRHQQARDLAGQLRTAMQTRSTIDQAIGRLSERHDLTAEAAWQRLRQASQDRNVKVRDLADSIVNDGMRL